MHLLTKPRLRVAAAVFSDLAVVWIVATLAADSWLVLLQDMGFVIVCLGLAFKAEEFSDSL